MSHRRRYQVGMDQNLEASMGILNASLHFGKRQKTRILKAINSFVWLRMTTVETNYDLQFLRIIKWYLPLRDLGNILG